MPSSSPTTSDCSFLEPCEVDKKGKKPPKFQMCMYDASKDEYKDTCQTVDDLEEDLAKGDGDYVAKCGNCYTLGVNILPTGDDDCAGIVESCGVKNGVGMYPMCMWDAKKGDAAPTTTCQNESQLQKDIKKGHILVHCGSCDDTDFFEGYFPSPYDDIDILSKTNTGKSKKGSTTKKTNKSKLDEVDVGVVEFGEEIAPERVQVDISSCDWESTSTCGTKNNSKEYPVCLWDTSKGKETSKCVTLSKLEYYMGKGDELLSCEGYCS